MMAALAGIIIKNIRKSTMSKDEKRKKGRNRAASDRRSNSGSFFLTHSRSSEWIDNEITALMGQLASLAKMAEEIGRLEQLRRFQALGDLTTSI